MTSPEEYPENPIVFESLPEGAEHLLSGMSGGRSDEPLDLEPALGKGHQSRVPEGYIIEEEPFDEWGYGSPMYPRDEMGAGWHGSRFRYGRPVIVTDAGHMPVVPPHDKYGGEVEMSYGKPLNLELVVPGLAEMLAALASGKWSKTGIGGEAPATGATTNQEENGEQ